MNDPSPVDTFTAKVQAAQADLQHGIDRAGLRDDPFRHPMQALSSVMGLFPEMVGQITNAIDQARHPMDAEVRVQIVAAVSAIYERQARAERQDRLALARTGAWKGWRRRGLIGAGIAVALLGAGAAIYSIGWSYGGDARIAELCQGAAVREQDGGRTCSWWMVAPMRKNRTTVGVTDGAR